MSKRRTGAHINGATDRAKPLANGTTVLGQVLEIVRQ
jgi:hypothetical protein